ncbi:MAG: tRNA (adenosine(37)-N6)-threonylcarbamoyltransferase complex transferase subunit TsaD, partial [Clostridia bacterium]|nr:tRNA (adenosine(37)-N6)-threonylcarbamoyltransferase complex transferase subunit TsaD [Clostridia bacterium]
ALYPAPILCTDNAAMIAAAGYFAHLKGEKADMTLNAVPNLHIGEGH